MPPGDDLIRELAVFLFFYLDERKIVPFAWLQIKRSMALFSQSLFSFFLPFHQLGREKPGELWNFPTWEDLRVPESQNRGAGRLLRDQISQTSQGRDDAPKLRERTRLAQDCQSQ